MGDVFLAYAPPQAMIARRTHELRGLQQRMALRRFANSVVELLPRLFHLHRGATDDPCDVSFRGGLSLGHQVEILGLAVTGPADVTMR